MPPSESTAPMPVTTVNMKEYSAVREGVGGIMDLSSRGRILVGGRDAAMFLNGLVTNDVKALAVNSWIPAVFASVQGRLIAAVRIIRREDGFLIDTEEASTEKVSDLLQRFTLAGDFHVTDLSATTGLLSVQGKGAPDWIRIEFGRETSELERGQVARTDNGMLIFPATHTAEEGFDIFLDEEISEYWWNRLIDDGVRPIHEETQEVLRIEAGIPRYGIDMDETTVVSETNLDDAISFTKGCYVGQEIIIRIKHRGHVAKKLTGIQFSQERVELENGMTVLSEDGQEIGQVTSWVISPNVEMTVAMAYIKFDYLKMMTPIQVQVAGRSIKGIVSELPLVRGSWYDLIDNQVPA